jgi:hypothetical protein
MVLMICVNFAGGAVAVPRALAGVTLLAAA